MAKRKASLVFPTPAPLDRYYVLPLFRSWQGLTVGGDKSVRMVGQGLGFLPVWDTLERFQADNPGVQPMIFTIGGNDGVDG